MMFLVIFSSLAAVMAVVAQGNLRTADSAMKVSRAMSAAETGLVFAKRRLLSEGRRFVVKKGVIDKTYAHDLWVGAYDEGADGDVVVLDASGYDEEEAPAGIMHAIRNAHAADEASFDAEVADGALPDVDTESGLLLVKPIKLGSETGSPYFRLRYRMKSGEDFVTVTSTGYDGDISRTLSMQFQITKKIEYAVISPSRIMIGKNVMIEGPLGSRFGVIAGELDSENGDPLVMRSDFYYLSDDLDAVLDSFYAKVADYDADGDARLRPNHPDEGAALEGDGSLVDYDGDEFVDDFDLFMDAFDSNDDLMIVYDSEKAADAGLGAMSAEFDVDLQLARLIDQSNSDRNGDGEVNSTDVGLGYNDGVVDANDQYAKVRGRLAFAVARSPWDTANDASYQTVVHGPIRPPLDKAAASFEVGENDLREITTEMFDTSASWFESKADSGASFADQVTAGVAAGGEYIQKEDNTYEKSPYGSENAYDYYQRPVYRNMTFTNVRIPMGENALFEDCTFVGVTFVETATECDDENWNYCGALMGPAPSPAKFDGLTATYEGAEVTETKSYSNNLRFHDCTFLGSIAGAKPEEYTHWRNKLQITGQSRFFVDADDPDLEAQDDADTLKTHLSSLDDEEIIELKKSSMLLPGWSVDVGSFSNEVAEEPDLTPIVKLKGVIVAGILDVRGTADVFGTLLMTFRPTVGDGPLFYGGQADAFNTTLGYFGPADGDGEGVDPDEASFTGFGEIRLRYNPDALLPDGIPWPITIESEPNTYTEGGLL